MVKKRNKALEFRLENAYRFLLYLLPGALFLAYYPLISFGTNESMNFEISLPLIWLILFNILSFCLIFIKKLWRYVINLWSWCLLPIFVSLSIFWSLNPMRGILTVGVLWLTFGAVLAFWVLRDLLNKKNFKSRFWWIFFGTTFLVCGWCILQCILDLVGVSREYTLLCAGCTYHSFGFPHPNGFAIEPQFMGNLLLAPTIVAGYLVINRISAEKVKDRRKLERIFGQEFTSSGYMKYSGWLFLGLAAILFLTFSRGAIYALIVAMIVMTIWWLKKYRIWRAMLVWPLLLGAFLITLNAQGIMAANSPTEDNYAVGVARAINQLSLGTIELRESYAAEDNAENFSNEQIVTDLADELMEEDENIEVVKFDGYVVESTEIRLMLTRSAISVWSGDLKTILFGVGIGGAGQALYDADFVATPKEIVQNEYVSLLLEIGLVGCLIAISMIVVIVGLWLKHQSAKILVVTLMVAYGLSLMFFAGLPNALQIYLLPGLFMAFDLSKTRRLDDCNS